MQLAEGHESNWCDVPPHESPLLRRPLPVMTFALSLPGTVGPWQSSTLLRSFRGVGHGPLSAGGHRDIEDKATRPQASRSWFPHVPEATSSSSHPSVGSQSPESSERLQRAAADTSVLPLVACSGSCSALLASMGTRKNRRLGLQTPGSWSPYNSGL